MCLDEVRQRLRQGARASFWKRAALSLLVQRDIGGPARHGILHRLERIGTAHHERAAVIVFESVAKNFPRRHRQAALPQLSARMFGQTVVDALPKPNRRKRHGIQERLDGFVFRDHSPVSESVLLGELRKFLARALEVAPLRQVTAVGKRHMKNRVGIDVLETIIAELEFVVAQDRVSMDSVVRRRTNVVCKSAQSQVRGLHSAADGRPAFQHQAAIACLSQIRCRDQAVVSRARHHDIETFWHRTLHLRSQFSGRAASAARRAAPRAGLFLHARFLFSVSEETSFSQRETTTVATPLPIIFTAARAMLMNRSIPRISAIPPTGIVGITFLVATSATKAAPCTPLAPFDVSTATARIVSCWVSVSGVFVACATNSAAIVMYMLVPSVLKVYPVGTTSPTSPFEHPSLSSLAINVGMAGSDELTASTRRTSSLMYARNLRIPNPLTRAIRPSTRKTNRNAVA